MNENGRRKNSIYRGHRKVLFEHVFNDGKDLNTVCWCAKGKKTSKEGEVEYRRGELSDGARA